MKSNIKDELARKYRKEKLEVLGFLVLATTVLTLLAWGIYLNIKYL